MSQRKWMKLGERILVFLLCIAIMLGSSGMSVLAEELAEEQETENTEGSVGEREELGDIELSESNEDFGQSAEDEKGELEEDGFQEDSAYLEEERTRELDNDKWQDEDGYKWNIDEDGLLTIEDGESEFTRTSGSAIYWGWSEYSARVTSAKVTVTKHSNMSNLFNGCYNLKSVDFTGTDTSKVTDMKSMFSGCRSLTNLNMRGFKTSNVTDMSLMFDECSGLTSLDLSGFDTSKVTNMKLMFSDCSDLTSLDVRGFDTSEVTDMEGMFLRCNNLTSLDVSDFDTSNVRRMTYMFYGCNSLTSLDISRFDLSNVKDAGWMLAGLDGLQSIETPINVSIDIALPYEEMYDAEKNPHTILPKETDKSIILTKEKEKKYNVTFDFQGHGTNSTERWIAETKLTAPEVEEELGYAIEGWYRDEAYTTAWDFDVDTVTGNVTLYAKWVEVPTYTVTFDYQGHGSNTEKTVNEGTILTEVSVEDVLGYAFAGWYKDEECKTEWKFAEDTVIEATTLYAKWTEKAPEEYTVTFNLQGHGTEIASVKVKEGEKATAPTAPAAEGYTFGGWYKEAACTTEWKFDTDTVTADVTLYAKWTENKSEEPNKPEEDTLTVSPADKDESSYTEGRKDLNTIKAVIGTVKAKVYDGKPYLPTVKVTATIDGKNTTLIEGIDYRVLYENNVNAGTGKVIVKGNGCYNGEIKADLVINKKPASKLKVVAGGMAQGSTEKAPVYVYDGSKLLTEGKDYDLSGTADIASSAGKKDVTVTMKGNYAGTLTAKVEVYGTDAKVLKDADVTLEKTSYDYTGKAQKPSVTVKYNGAALEKSCYSVKYVNNKEAGTAYVIVTGKKGYTGSVVKTFTIKTSTSAFGLKQDIKAVTYNGKYQKPKAVVTVNGKTLKAGKDYVLLYGNNLHAGKATVTVKGLGNYAGTADKKFEFTINSQSVKKISVKGTKEADITYLKRALKVGTDYTITVGAESKGKVPVTIEGKGDFTGSVTKKVKAQ